MAEKIVKIGGAAGASIDSAIAVPQLLTVPGIDYLIFDYLAEGSMGVFGRMQAMNPALGYMIDFVDVHVGPRRRLTPVGVDRRVDAAEQRGTA